MYLPAHFSELRPEVLHAFIARHPLATLIISGADGITANHVPLLHEPERGPHGVLLGHVARANPLWREVATGVPALAVFHGPQAYVSPSHYPTKGETGKVVPTWNYAVVHAHGTLRAHDDPVWLAAFVRRLTERHEAQRPQPWAVDDAPADFIASQLRAIVGLEFDIAHLTGKFKLSQNRSDADRSGVCAGLATAGNANAAAVAAMMEDAAKRE